jgi:PAS domain S-box-containing protein
VDHKDRVASSSTSSSSEEGRYRLLIEAITDYAIYMLDPSGIVTSWNPGAVRFKGYEPSEVIGEHFSRFYSEEDRQRGLPQRGLETAIREGKFESEGWRIRKDGSRFWAHVIIHPIKRPNGELIGFAKITRDLSERKLAEDTLRRSEEQFRLLLQGVTDYAIYMLGPDGKVSSWNAGAEKIKGYRPEEIIGEHFSRFYSEEDRQIGAPQAALETAAREGRFEKEGWRVRKDGTKFWANVVIDPIRGSDGAVLGFAKITRDITERKRAEGALEQAREALFQSQKMDAIGQLTGGVAHDFNNLLMAVLGSLELLRKRLPDDPKMFRLIDNAIQGAQRGSVLTQRMLSFARRQELKSVPIDVPELLKGMLAFLQSSLGPSIRIETRFPDNLKWVLADANQLELAILNLSVNARDAMPKGGAIIISGREENILAGERQGRFIRLSIKDTGAGMDNTTLARAMEPFFTTKGVGKGTGLGLSMVHGMAEQLGGKFVLKSQEGEGTTAELWLPIAPKGTGADAVPDPSLQPLELSNNTLTVLAVDDDSLVLLNTTAMLEDLGHKVIEADSGNTALDALRREKVDLVITDQAMPNMTGIELADAIRVEWPDMPLILATGYTELPSHTHQHLVKLSKPFRQRALIDAVDEVLARPTKRPMS